LAQIYIALGSNMGDRVDSLEKAIQMLTPEIQLVSKSSIYETDPWGYEDQDAFLNQVIHAETKLEPQGVLVKLKSIESEMGRQETFRYGPRVIDLDLLFYNDLILSTDKLQIPHPQIPNRAFVLIPLREIAPDLNHPALGQSITELAAEVSKKGVRKYEKNVQ
jgi:2-amino-4-hydroxy-6-hydroxymethyldihydropteridine diphosphokinase